METAEQASPYPYPSENPSSAAPPRLATLAVPGRRKTPEPPLPPRSPRHPPLAPRPRNHHRSRTRSVATPRSYLDCRNVLILIVAGHFAPVYAAIPSLLDWHYSTLGRYAELGLALFGKLDEEIESRLFGELEEGIGLVADDVGRVMQGEVLAELERWFGGDAGALPTGWGRGPGRALETLMEDARRHFVVAIGPTTVGAAMAGVGTSVGVRTVAAGVAGRLTSGIGSAILRTAGRTVGPAAGIIGGVAGWLAVDYALREFEEWRGRDELEHALTALVDEEKERVRVALVSAVDEVKVTALGDFVPAQLR